MEAETEVQDPFSLHPVNIQFLGDFLHMMQDIHHLVHWAMRDFIHFFPWYLMIAGWTTPLLLQLQVRLLMAEIPIQKELLRMT